MRSVDPLVLKAMGHSVGTTRSTDKIPLNDPSPKLGYFSLRNSICSPNSSGLREFFAKSAAAAVESFVSFGTTLSLTLGNVSRLPSSDNFQVKYAYLRSFELRS